MMALRIGDIASSFSPCSDRFGNEGRGRGNKGRGKGGTRGTQGTIGKTPEMVDPKHDNDMCIVNIVVEL
jgi:hypothetical protein